MLSQWVETLASYRIREPHTLPTPDRRTLLSFFISLSIQMMNQLFLGQSMGVAIAAVILPLVLSLILSLIACQQYGQCRWIVVPTTLLLTLALTLFLAASLYCC